MIALKLAFAGLLPIVLHYGAGVVIIAVCLALAFFASSIPFIGAIRRDLVWVAIAAAAFMFAHAMGMRDEAARCAAKEAVIEKAVTKAVDDTKQPAAQGEPDPYDTEK